MSSQTINLEQVLENHKIKAQTLFDSLPKKYQDAVIASQIPIHRTVSYMLHVKRQLEKQSIGIFSSTASNEPPPDKEPT